MIREPVARRYAHALFDAAQARGLLDQVGEDLDAFTQLLRSEPRLGSLLLSPQATPGEKQRLLQTLLIGRVQPLVLELLWLLIGKKRLAVVGQIIEGFRLLLEQHRNIVRAEVTTAVPLTGPLEARLKAALDRRTGQRVMIEKRVDPRILGGVMVRLGDQILDRSVRRALLEMRNGMMEAPIFE